MGLEHFGSLLKEIFCQDCFEAIAIAGAMETDRFRLPSDTWARIVYELAATYHQWPANRRRLIDLMTPLYYGRVASFVNETKDMDSLQTERLVERQAELFVEAKDYLISVWDNPRQWSVTFMQAAENM